MKTSRKTFIKNLVAGSATVTAGSILSVTGNDKINSHHTDEKGSNYETTHPGERKSSCDGKSDRPEFIPDMIAGMTLMELRNDYRDRIFNQYLPFWEKGGYDKELGGFMCELYDDGKVQNDEKYIWYQSRGIWVYSFLYNNLAKERKYLDMAIRTRDFIVKNMYLGDGVWRESVNRKGMPVESTVAQGTNKDIYGALFSAAGLIELYKASGNEKDLEIAKTSLWSSVQAYEKTDYEGIIVPGIDVKGLRTLGHSFMIVWILTNLLSFHKDRKLEELQDEHINHIVQDFWNGKYGINNENLFHDYSRIPGSETIMYTGHYLETLWIILHEALRRSDKSLFDKIKERVRRLVEMSWDYVFGGLGTENYYVFGSDGKCQGPEFDLKVMWAHTELLIATMTILESTGETWAREWYERGREYALRTMANTENGVWRQAVDRFGNDKQRPEISIYRKDNFHQVRYQMLNLMSIERMMSDKNKISQIQPGLLVCGF
jgi:mannose/cellobiose epimerase-like protein (N-acyl-D-glucosamine 2-epimerase family)